jgi:F-type H+-transporting ATPase subunit epsilon
MEPSYTLQIISPKGTEYREEVVHTRLPDERGYVGVLANHAPLITSSPGGRVDVRLKNGETKNFRVGAGFFEVIRNQATFLVESFHGS